MTVIDRLIYLILSLLMIVSSVALLAFAVPIYAIEEYIRLNISYYSGTPEMIALAVVILLISLRGLWGVFRVKRPPKEQPSVSQTTEIGEVQISLETIESMVLRVAKSEVKGLREVKADIKAVENGVLIQIKGKVLADLELPQLSEQLQKAVKDNIEARAGINVSEVKVLIENITSDASRPSKS